MSWTPRRQSADRCDAARPGERLEREARISESGHRHHHRDVPRVRETLRRQDPGRQRRLHALLGGRRRIVGPGDRPEPHVGRAARAGGNPLGDASIRRSIPPSSSWKPGATCCSTTSIRGARGSTTLPITTCRSSWTSGRSSRPSHWMVTHNRENCSRPCLQGEQTTKQPPPWTCSIHRAGLEPIWLCCRRR